MLSFVLREYPFLGVPVWYAFLFAKIVQHVLAIEAERGLERVGSVVDACMNDLGNTSVLQAGAITDPFTSELRLLVSVPTAPCFSIRRVDVPSLAASLRAIANPTAPAPTTCHFSVIRAAGRESQRTTWVKSALREWEVEKDRELHSLNGTRNPYRSIATVKGN